MGYSQLLHLKLNSSRDIVMSDIIPSYHRDSHT
jgi:hypothetical protein